MAKRQKENSSPRVTNRRAFHDYQIGEKVECGIVLSGTEVKAIRAGRATLNQAFARVEPATMELWLHNMDIGTYDHAAPEYQHEGQRKRKLLARRRQIAELNKQSSAKGATLVPLALYFNSRGIAKVEIGVGVGKRQHDKREALKQKQADRAIDRAMTRKRIG